MTVIAQDPGVKLGRRILRAQVEVPLEVLRPGPEDGTARHLYQPATFDGNDAYERADDDQTVALRAGARATKEST